MATINGIPVNFGFTGTDGIQITGLTANLLLQSADESAEADKDEVRAGQGDIVNRSWYDQHKKASLECVITAAGIAAAVTATTLASLLPGTIIIISACASMPDLVATTWEVQSGAAIKGSNTNAKRVTIPLEIRAGITAAAAT